MQLIIQNAIYILVNETDRLHFFTCRATVHPLFLS